MCMVSLLQNASGAFQCPEAVILATVKQKFALVYVDDIVIFTNNSKERIRQNPESLNTPTWG